LYRNLTTDLLRYEKIQTTEAKAKEVRRLAEEMITKAKKGDLHARRQALAELYSEDVVD
jgi:large subunit ribosomal protein L17